MKKITKETLLDFIFEQMSKLDEGLINSDKARAQASLAKQANNSIRLEIDQANTLMKLDLHLVAFPDTKAELTKKE